MPLSLEVVARVVAVDPAGRVLLTQRAGRDYWVPPGGRVDPGEPLPEAARREAVEETRVSVEMGPLLYVWEIFERDRHRLECAFLGRTPDLDATDDVEDLGPVGGVRHRRLVSPDAFPGLKIYPVPLATPGLGAMIRAFAAGRAGRDPYLGRTGAGQRAFPHRLNARVILRHGDHILLVSGELDDREAFWVLPGGLVEPGEPLTAALVRETAEETGLRVTPERLLYVREFLDERLGEHAIECYFQGRVTGGLLRMGVDPTFRDASTIRGKVAGARWFDRRDLQDMVIYPEVVRDRLWADIRAETPDCFLGTARRT